MSYLIALNLHDNKTLTGHPRLIIDSFLCHFIIGQELQEEKKRSRDLSIEKLNTIKNIKEEVNNNKKTEIDAFMKRMEKV